MAFEDKDKKPKAEDSQNATDSGKGAPTAPALPAEDDSFDDVPEIKKADKVKISSGGGYSNATFKGKRFSRKGVVVDVGSLGWSNGDWVEAHKNPMLVIEPMIEVKDEDGNKKLKLADPRIVRAPGSQRID